ncbi:hypothetical protein OCS_01019 [Ophiocordyceps sinensis CO18]|uniref:Uncharacterized protein n=1 Tax=Ophiocordyceps sinensis (strain Co18 / CGMCC 3.14243) TaxID=911162 RepID=T5AKZ5_OPHSC|nr:hypothetical protein OCS_01019 [Ophiocordyceps sinensis CO18]
MAPVALVSSSRARLEADVEKIPALPGREADVEKIADKVCRGHGGECEYHGEHQDARGAETRVRC